MVRACAALLACGALAIIPIGMGGIPLLKLLFFALAALMGATGLYGTGLHSPVCRQAGLLRQIRTAKSCAPCSPVLNCIPWCFLLAFFAVVFLSPLWSIAPLLSVAGVEPRFEGVLAYGVFLGLALMAWGMAHSGKEQSLLQAVAWSNVGVVLYGLLQIAGRNPFGSWWDAEVFLGRVFSTVGQPNMLGQFLVLTAPLAVLAAWRWKGASTATGVLAANLTVLLATGSRAGAIGLGSALLFGAFAGGMRCASPSSRLLGLRPLPLAPTASSCVRAEWLRMFRSMPVVLLCGGIGVFLFLQRFAIPHEWGRSLEGRVAIWRDAVSMIRARPMGWGLETTGLLFPRFQRAPLTAYESLTTSVDRAHSKPLDLLLTVGPLGFFSYYIFLLSLFLRCFRVWRSGRDPLILAGMAGIAGVSASLLFGFEGVVTHAFFWLVCGMLVGLLLPAPVRRSFSEGGRRACLLAGRGRSEVLPIFFIVLLMIIFATLLSLSSRFTAKRAERAFGSDTLALAVQLSDTTVRRAPWDRALLVRFIETALLARERAADPATQEALDVVLMKRLHHLERLTSGFDLLSPSLRAWHAALRGERKEALAFLDDARLRAPFSTPRLRMAGKVAELLGDTSMRETVHVELTRMLPPWWDDPADPRHRILWKENPWLEEIIPSPFGGEREG